MSYSRLHIVIGLTYLCLGMVLGLIMGFTMGTRLVVVHAHWMLIGGVLTILHGLVLFHWNGTPRLETAQFSIHHIGTIVVATGSPFFYGTDMPHAVTGPLIGAASALVLLGAVLMIPVVLLNSPTAPTQ